MHQVADVDVSNMLLGDSSSSLPMMIVSFWEQGRAAEVSTRNGQGTYRAEEEDSGKLRRAFRRFHCEQCLGL